MPSYPYYTEPTHTTGAVTVGGAGARTTATSSTEGRLVVDAVDKVFLLEPNKHPLVSLLTNVGRVWDGKAWKGSSVAKASTGNPEFKWFEDVYGARYTKATTVSSNTEIHVAASAYIFTVGDIVKNARTGENMLVTTVATGGDTTELTVTRAYGTTTTAATAVGDGLFIIGNANAENTGARNSNTTQTSPETNYTQIWKTTIALSGTEDAAKLYGGRDLPYLRGKKATEHALDIERSFWFGEKRTGTDGTYTSMPIRTTGGVLEFINGGNSYVQNQGGALTAPDMNTFLREAFTYGNNRKMLFAGGLVLQAINEISRGQLQTKMDDTTYGVKISQWTTTFGTVDIVHNPLFVEDYAGYGFLLDMECFRYRYMEGRDTKLMTNVQAPDVDGIVDQYLTEAGLERKQASRHAIIKGVTA